MSGRHRERERFVGPEPWSDCRSDSQTERDEEQERPDRPVVLLIGVPDQIPDHRVWTDVMLIANAVFWCGGRSRARTCDPGLVRAVLFHLSYPPVPEKLRGSVRGVKCPKGIG